MNLTTLKAAAVLSMLVTPALADGKVEDCIEMAEMGKRAMEVRQSGVDLATVIGAISKDTDGEALTGVIDLMQTVYKAPLLSSEQDMESAVNEFSNTIFMACMKD